MELAVRAQAPLDVQRPNMRVYSNSASLTDVISRAASDPAMDVAKLQALLEMHERLRENEAEREFNMALADVQASMGRIGTDSKNSQTNSKYASYAALDRILRPLYTERGLALSFDTGDAPENFVNVVCRVSHREGHVRTYHVLMPADGKGAKGGDVMTRTHATGAALSYGSRYLLKMIFNVAVGEDDDDGNGASPQKAPPPPPTPSNIDAAQLAEIRNMLNTLGRPNDAEMFCKMFKIESVPDLLAKDFQSAVGLLTTTITKRAKK